MSNAVKDQWGGIDFFTNFCWHPKRHGSRGNSHFPRDHRSCSNKGSAFDNCVMKHNRASSDQSFIVNATTLKMCQVPYRASFSNYCRKLRRYVEYSIILH
jgi:hypothetical protein